MNDKKGKCHLCNGEVFGSCETCNKFLCFNHINCIHDNNSQKNESTSEMGCLPSVEIVEKWKRKDVLDFLQIKKEDLDIESSDIEIIEQNRVPGNAFLGLTEQILVNHPYNLLAGAISRLVEEIREQGI